MNLDKKNSDFQYIVFSVTVFYLLYRILYRPSCQYIFAFVFIAGLHYFLTKNIISSLVMAIVFCIIWEMIYPNKCSILEGMRNAKREQIEGFADSKKGKNSKKKESLKKDDKDQEDEEDDHDGENLPGDETKLMEGGYDAHEVNKTENFTDESGEGVTEPYMDVGRSFLEAYKNLSPKQIEGLTFDTKELLTTQQKLIETLNAVGPTLKEGKNILDTFKNYFGEDGKMNI